jgi:Cu+-exporting ATPase
MEKVHWKVQGISCTNCVLTISDYLKKMGLQDVSVNMIGGDVSFNSTGQTAKEKIISGIQSLGYTVDTGDSSITVRKPFLSTHWQRFWFCLLFTLPLMLHMFVHIHWLMHPGVQFALTLPVFLTGIAYFGRSALRSLRNGKPNMNVLITLGATAAFAYSLTGALQQLGPQYLFFETTATIITLVFLGNWLEDQSVAATQRSLKKLAINQKIMANMIAFDDQHQELIFPVESSTLKTGDLILIKAGEQVPADCKILWGDASVNESILTGESIPVSKTMKDALIGGSLLETGTVKAQVTAAGSDTVMAGILNLVKTAQGEKPPVQQMADKISAIFVPVVISIALITFVLNYFAFHISFSQSLLRAIAVLVIACPCAMGLATPAAIAVGLGRGARNGILFRNAKSLELFNNIRQIVFDKTGTLTNGQFIISQTAVFNTEAEEFRRIVYSLEKYSNHPIGKSIAVTYKTTNELRWKTVEEIKGKGIRATDKEGNTYTIGSHTLAALNDDGHHVYVTRNNQCIGWLDVQDELRPEARAVIHYFKSKGIRTILLSGDTLPKCTQVAQALGIDEVYARQTPEQKLHKIAELNATAPVAMVGDGVNDAPALAKATIGISMSDATQLAMQSAQVVLMNGGLQKLPAAIGLGKHTFLTIKQNLFWAFIYNIIAIPVAAFGLLTPTLGALVMGLSDVVLAINSVRLNYKKVA